MLASLWKDIQGKNNWKGLVDVEPMNPTFRAEIIRYGELAQVNYDAFDSDTHSVYCGSSKYAARDLFKMVDKEDCGYEVTRYLFATLDMKLPKFLLISERDASERWSGVSNWIAYVAVANDKEMKRLGRRDIVVAWRGTVMRTEWVADVTDVQMRPDFEAGQKKLRVEKGFLSLYTSKKAGSKFNETSARDQLLCELKKLLKRYEGEEVSITITGHSLGAALAVLSGYDICANICELNGSAGRRPMVTVFSFAGPRVGNWAFKQRTEELGLKVLRVVNVHDMVPKVPGLRVNEARVWGAITALGCSSHIDMLPWAYFHVGQELRFDSHVSPYIQKPSFFSSRRNMSLHHNLEVYLHMLDGFQGFGQNFTSVFGRSPALVNKSSDFLVRKLFCPSHWWQERNKGLVKNERGHWVHAPRPDHRGLENPQPSE